MTLFEFRLGYWHRTLCAVVLGTTLVACAGDEDPDPTTPGEPPVEEPQEPVDPEPPADLPLIRINEAATSNNDFEDDDGDKSDWIELYNPGTQAVNLAGWSITDDAGAPSPWVFPDFELAPGAYTIVWASDKDRAGAALHTNFKLSDDGEVLSLFDADGELVDSLIVIGAPAGISSGRNSASEPALYATPTPGAANATESFAGVVASEVQFSHAGGEGAPASVELSGAGEGEVIRYTLDATVPSADSPIYEGPIAIDATTVVRARAFRDQFIPSTTASRTFIPGETHDLPVVTLITDPLNFFDMDYGIYVLGTDYQRQAPHYGANFWEDWERPIHFSFYEPDGTFGVGVDMGVKIFGGWSRANEQRSLALFARSRYGAKNVKYPLFPELSYEKFEGFVLRNSGNDWLYTMLRDAVLTSLMEGSGLDYQAYRPTAVYLNNEYWGLYNLREKVNEHFLASKHDLDADDITILEGNATVVEGSNEDYLALREFISTSDLTDPAVYAQVGEWMDLDNFAQYQIAQIYFDNTDWPANNIKYWRSPATKWRWILYDTDFGFGIYNETRGYANNTLAHATCEPQRCAPEWGTEMLRGLLQSPEFARLFINHFADALNGRFLPERVHQRIAEYASVIETEIPRQFDRWVPSLNLNPREPARGEWQDFVDVMRNFATLRPAAVTEHLQAYFGLEAPLPITVQHDPAMGQVRLNSLTLADAEWSGQYFPGIPVTLRAEAAEGYRFVGWSGAVESAEAELTIDPADAAAVTATFEPIAGAE